MEDNTLWGLSQVPDAEVIHGNYEGTNTRVPKIGTQLSMTREHVVELMRCKDDIKYFAEHYYTINVGAKRELMQLWDIQKDALDHLENNKRVVINASRQTSKSTLLRLYLLHRLIFSSGQENIGMIANVFTFAKIFLKELKESYEYLPNFIKPNVLEYNMEKIVFANENGSTGSSIIVQASGPNALRGTALTCVCIDEAAFINSGSKEKLDELILASVTPTLEAVDNNPDSPVKSSFIMVSTPYGRDGVFASKYFEAEAHQKLIEEGKSESEIRELGKWSPWRKFDILWSDHPARGDQWYENKVAEIGERDFKIEFGGSFELGDSAPTIVSKETVDVLEDGCIVPPISTMNETLTETDHQHDKSFRVWVRPVKGRIYHAGVDVAEGVGGCYSTIEILDITDLKNIEQVAEYQSNSISPEDFAMVCVTLFNSYNQCWASVEKNNIGKLLINLIANIHGYTKLVTLNASDKTTERDEGDKAYGINSHNNTKTYGVSAMKYYLNNTEQIGNLKIHSEKLLDEMKTFVKTDSKNSNVKWGRSSKDVHDDLVDAFMWCIMALHNKVVDRYYNLTFEGFNSKGYPIQIESAKYKNLGDGDRNSLFINQQKNANTMIFLSENEGFDGGITIHDPDMDWLQNM